jgi:hypothetical protein
MPQPTQNRQGLVPYKQLTWEDFPVNDRVAGLDAQTRGTITYDYRTRWELKNGVYTSYITEITFRSWFDTTQSWRRSRKPINPTWLLKHEQGHLDIMHLAALALMRLKPDYFTPETGMTQQEAETKLATQVKRTFEGAIERAKRRQERYDEETRHSRHVPAQEQWNMQIARELKNAQNAPS